MTYNAFSSDYDRFVNWPARLAFELPFLEAQIRVLGSDTPARVLDAACGTGMHAIALAQHGMLTAGADISAGMVAQAQANARAAGLDLTFEVVGFGELARTFAVDPLYPFDALLCLGNSLPHLLSPQALAAALADFAACLRTGGLLVLQNRNFDSVLAGRERWMEPQAHRESEQEWIFLRFYDYLPDDLIDFNILTLHRVKDGPWEQRLATTTRLRPLRHDDLLQALKAAGFASIQTYGSLKGEPYEPETSGNLVVTATVPDFANPTR